MRKVPSQKSPFQQRSRIRLLKTRNPRKTVFVTGASSGLGHALAREYAEAGTKIGIVARRKEKLYALGDILSRAGSVPFVFTGDVRDRNFMAESADSFLKNAGVPDIVIANAGTRGNHLGSFDQDDKDLIDTNFHGVRHTILPFIPSLLAAGRGQILVISSLAAKLALPGAAGYCASKAAINRWAGSLRLALSPRGIDLTIVNPGFIRTEMTRDNPYPMPFVMDADEAARIIRRKSSSGPSELNFPLPMSLGISLLALLPDRIRESFLSRFQARLYLSWPPAP